MSKVGTQLHTLKASEETYRAQRLSLRAEAVGAYKAESAMRAGHHTCQVGRRFVTLACATDIYRRKILSSVLLNTPEANFWVSAITEAGRLTGPPGIINTYQGS